MPTENVMSPYPLHRVFQNVVDHSVRVKIVLFLLPTCSNFGRLSVFCILVVRVCCGFSATPQGSLDWFEVDVMCCCSVCSVLQCVAVCCSLLQCVAVCHSVL